MTKSHTKKPAKTDDWLVIISLPGGAGSWARGPGRDETIERCKRIFKQDWKSLFDFKKGMTVKANVLDVTGYDEVEWSHSVTVDGKPYPGTIEMVEITY